MGGCCGFCSKQKVEKTRKTLKQVQTVHRLPRQMNHSVTFPIAEIYDRIRKFSFNGQVQLSRERLDGALLSAFEKSIIRDSWNSVVVQREAFGRNVYRRVFECEPSLKNLFSWSTDIEPDEFETSEAYNRQARTILLFIDECVANLHNIQIMADKLLQLGRYHTKFRGYGLKPDHWVIFKFSLMLSIAACSKNEDKDLLLEAWNTFITFIIETMRLGYETKLKSYYERSFSVPIADSKLEDEQNH